MTTGCDEVGGAVYVCCRCLREGTINPLEEDGLDIDPNRMVCDECLTGDEVREDLRRAGIEPEGLAARMMAGVADRLDERGEHERAEWARLVARRLGSAE